MSVRLILNADDFGLTLGVNRAIRELHQAGVLTSATLMANGAAFDDAVAIAHANPALGVGCHIVLTDGVPVSPPETIPTLLGPDGQTLRPKLTDFVQALLRGKIRAADIEREARAQVRKLRQAGIHITHLDTHKHTHLFPAVTHPLLRIAEEASIRGIRNPFEASWCRSIGHGSLMRRLQIALLDRFRRQFVAHRQIRNAQVRSTDGTIGVSATGSLSAGTLRQILTALPEGTWELVCHPGYNDADLDAITTRLREHRNIEREALLAEVSQAIAQPNAPQLIHYGSLGFGSTRSVGVTLSETGSAGIL